MAKFCVNNLFSLRRAYNTIAACNLKPESASFAKKGTDSISNESKAIKEVFWMRHPDTGNWVPETHFEEVDVAELRQKLLPKKSNS